jgi:hypothetical protein
MRTSAEFFGFGLRYSKSLKRCHLSQTRGKASEGIRPKDAARAAWQTRVALCISLLSK